MTRKEAAGSRVEEEKLKGLVETTERLKRLLQRGKEKRCPRCEELEQMVEELEAENADLEDLLHKFSKALAAADRMVEKLRLKLREVSKGRDEHGQWIN